MQLPLAQKYCHGVGRYLMRRYMNQYLPADIFNQYKKSTGIAILPGTMEKFKQQYLQGDYNEAFKNLPYQQYFSNGTQDLALIKMTHAYMIRSYIKTR